MRIKTIIEFGAFKMGVERRPNKQLEDFSKEDEVSDIEDVDDDDGDEDTDDEIIEIPDDPAMEARLAALRAENALLVARAEQEAEIRAVVMGTAGEWKRNVEALQASLFRAKALIKEREGAASGVSGGDGGCKPPGPSKREGGEDDEDKSKDRSRVVSQN